MKKINLLPVVCLTFSFQVSAQNQFIETRVADSKIKPTAPGLSNQWSRHVISNSSKESGLDWHQTLESLKEKLKKGEYKKGQTLILNILSHTDGKSGKSQFYDMDSKHYEELAKAKKSVALLAEIVQLSESKGVNLGIIDLTPFAKYSNDLLKHAKGNTCIIVNEKTPHFRYNQGFDHAFNQSLGRPGTSLEDAYLAAFEHSESYDAPLINTPNHEFAKKQIALINSDKEGIKLTELNATSKMRKLAEVDGECAINDSFDALVKDLQKISDHDNKSKEAKSLYMSSLESYRRLQLEYFKKFAKIYGKDVTGDVVFESSVKNPETGKPLVSHKLSYKSLKDEEIDEFIYAIEHASSRYAKSPHHKLYKEAYKDVAKQMRAERKNLIAKDEKRITKEEQKLQYSMDKELNRKFEEVFKLSNKYYQNLYKYRPTDTLACKKIKF